jgi:Ca-activated chloride channel family protein
VTRRPRPPHATIGRPLLPASEQPLLGLHDSLSEVTVASETLTIAKLEGSRGAESRRAWSARPRGEMADGYLADSEIAEVDVDEPRTNGERFQPIEDFGFVATADQPTSTFAAETDTGAYAFVRRMLRDGQLPPRDLVRIEEFLNTFDYGDEPPAGGDDTPFAVHSEYATCPWNPSARLLRIGLKGKVFAADRVPPRNLVFLLDVSGSMNSDDKLGLVRKAMHMLTDQLVEKDRVSIVVYAGASGAVLEPTSGADKARILAALDALEAGGSTAGAAGIELAYELAARSFDPEAINRVILCTDGDFNVGTSNVDELQKLIETKRETGVFLTVLGVGRGNTRDDVMETLARCGNGQYAYLDSEREARRVLVEQAGGSLVTIAKDVKIQVEFDPGLVESYRLIGYSNRRLRNEDFADDTKDAGEIGAGHAVCALYEFVPTAAFAKRGAPDRAFGELRLRFKEPDLDASELRTTPLLVASGDAETRDSWAFAAAVATFGLALRESEEKASLALAGELAQGALGADPFGHRAEFVELVGLAAKIRAANDGEGVATAGR